VKSLLDQLRVNIVSEWHGEKSIAVSRGQLCSTFEFPTRAMTLGATARSRLWSRVGSKLMDWSTVYFLVKDRSVELSILRKYIWLRKSRLQFVFLLSPIFHSYIIISIVLLELLKPTLSYLNYKCDAINDINIAVTTATILENLNLFSILRTFSIFIQR